MRLHRPRRDPAGQGQLALPRRRGGLLDGPDARAGGLPQGRGRGRDHVRPPRAAGPRGGPPDGPGLLHLRGRLRLRDRGRDDAADRRDGPRRERHRLRADRGSRRPQAALRSLRGAARVPLALAPRPRPLPPLPRQGRRRRGQRPARGARRRRPAAARQRRDRPRDGGDRGAHPRLPPGPEDGQQGRGRCRPCPRPRLRPRRLHRGRRLDRGPRGRRLGRPLLRRRQRARERPRPARRALLLGQRHGHRGQHGRRLLRGDRLDAGRASERPIII